MQLSLLKPPNGWAWQTRPTLRSSGILAVDYGQAFNSKTYKTRIRDLANWASKNNLEITPAGHAYIEHGYVEYFVIAKLTVKANKSTTNAKFFGSWACSNTNCGQTIEAGSLACPSCHQNTRCQNCEKTGLRLFRTIHPSRGGAVYRLCAQCSIKCITPKCTERVWKAAYGKAFTGLCNTCAPVSFCRYCSLLKPAEKVVTVNDTDTPICVDCKASRTCDKCQAFRPKGKFHTLGGQNLCPTCHSAVLDQTRVRYEKFDKNELPVHGTLLIPSLPGRPTRIISVETEVDGDRNVLGETLYRCGIVKVPWVESYGSSQESNANWVAHLKHDGSVTGGELISYLLSLDTDEHANAFLEVLKKLRSLNKVGKVQYNSNCGGHIHIDAHNFGYSDVWRLLTIWNYLEDVIYRLAGAGSPYGHRSLDPRHDRANHGGGYASSPVKGPFGTKGVMSQNIYAQNRMSGLNFKPYLSSVGGCRCGAFSKHNDIKTCTCALAKCTIEWRVWNSQANPRILHAWIAFMQAMHAFAENEQEADAEWEKKFLPTLPFFKQPFKELLTEEYRNTVQERLTWVFTNLVFTEAERDSLIYAFKQSELKELGLVFLESLRNVPGPANPEKKPVPRNPFKRPVPVVVKKPTTEQAEEAFGQLAGRNRYALRW